MKILLWRAPSRQLAEARGGAIPVRTASSERTLQSFLRAARQKKIVATIPHAGPIQTVTVLPYPQ